MLTGFFHSNFTATWIAPPIEKEPKIQPKDEKIDENEDEKEENEDENKDENEEEEENEDDSYDSCDEEEKERRKHARGKNTEGISNELMYPFLYPQFGFLVREVEPISPKNYQK